MDEPQDPTRRNRKIFSWSIALVVLVVVAVGGGVALIIGATTGGGKKAQPAAAVETGPRYTTAGQDMLSGNATPSYPTGDASQIAVVALGPITYSDAGGTMPIAIRNNTSAAVSRISITGIAEDSSGTQIATGTSQQQVEPAQLAAGQLGFSFIHFAPTATQVPPNSAYEFTIKSNVADTTPFNTASVKVIRAAPGSDSITGAATNTTGAKLQGPYTVQAYCFDAKSNLVSVQTTTTNQIGDIPPGGTVNFAVPLHGTDCTTFLVGINGLYT